MTDQSHNLLKVAEKYVNNPTYENFCEIGKEDLFAIASFCHDRGPCGGKSHDCPMAITMQQPAVHTICFLAFVESRYTYSLYEDFDGFERSIYSNNEGLFLLTVVKLIALLESNRG